MNYNVSHYTDYSLKNFLSHYNTPPLQYKPLTIVYCKYPIRSTANSNIERVDYNFNNLYDNPKIYIERPETNLSDHAQTKIINKIIRLINNKITIVVETGSSMLINSMRVKIKTKEINYNDVVINFIEFTDELITVGSLKVSQIYINEDGRIDNWPEGFCDDIEKILADLL